MHNLARGLEYAVYTLFLNFNWIRSIMAAFFSNITNFTFNKDSYSRFVSLAGSVRLSIMVLSLELL